MPPFQAHRLPDGRIEVPIPAYGPDGVRGDGVAILVPGDWMFDDYDEFLPPVDDDENLSGACPS
jgi:hypothetical protein